MNECITFMGQEIAVENILSISQKPGELVIIVKTKDGTTEFAYNSLEEMGRDFSYANDVFISWLERNGE